MAKKSKSEMLNTLRALVRDALALRYSGSVGARLAHENGVVDGYLRGLLDSGLCDQQELLALMAAERAAVSGPAVRHLSASDPAFSL